MSGQALDEKSARVRNLLSSYYGTSDVVPESPASSRSTTSSSAFRAPRSHGLDSTAFDCDRFMKQLLATSKLSQLLQKQNQISSEVKTLDSDMQMLVYENYNKFISATDTIRTMKNSVNDMDGKMQTLQHVIGKIHALLVSYLGMEFDMSALHVIIMSPVCSQSCCPAEQLQSLNELTV